MKARFPIGVFASSLITFREKLLSGLMWNGLSAVSLQGSNLLASGLLAHLLGLDAFGAYALVVATVTTVANFAQGGCGFVAAKLIAENLGVNPATVDSILRLCALLTRFMGTVVTLVLLTWAPEFSAHVLNRPELQNEVRIAALSILFQVSTTFQMGALQGFAAFKQVGKASVFAGISVVVCLGIGAKLGGLYGAIVGFTLASALRAAICWLTLRAVRNHHRCTGRAPIRPQDVRLLWHIALPAGLAGLVTMPAQWLVNLGISSLPQGLTLLGIYTVATQIRQAALQIPTLLNSVTFAVMSRAKGAGLRIEFRRIFIANISANLCFGCLISAFVALTAREILSLWHVSSPESIDAMKILAISIIPELLAMSTYQLVQSSGRMWASLMQIAIPRDATYLAIALMFLPVHGLGAAAGAYLVAQLLGLCTTLATIRQTRNMSHSDGNSTQP